MALLQLGIALVDLVELDIAGNQVIEFQIALLLGIQQTGHVNTEPIAAHRRSWDFSFTQEIVCVQLDLHAEWHHPNGGRRAPGRKHSKVCSAVFLRSHSLERVPQPKATRLPQRFAP
jgi:hypothetical protein